MNKIKEILNNNFMNNLIKHKIILGINNIEMKNAFKDNKWIGTNLCGPSSVICYYILINNNYKNIRVYTNTILSKEYCEDHTFLIYNNIVIDPTINQFLNNKISNDIFVGNYQTLNNLVINNSEINTLNLWEKQNDITKKVINFINIALKE